jgi:NO-binding membrane sensor protein with MHYT domain
MTLFGSLMNSFSGMLGEQLKKQICFTLTITIITLIISIITAGSAWMTTGCLQRSPKRTSIQPGLGSCLMKENRRIIDRFSPNFNSQHGLLT